MLLFAQDLMTSSREELQAFLRTILVLTTLQSVVYIFQNLTGLNVTFWSNTIETMTDSCVSGETNAPVFHRFCVVDEKSNDDVARRHI